MQRATEKMTTLIDPFTVGPIHDPAFFPLTASDTLTPMIEEGLNRADTHVTEALSPSRAPESTAPADSAPVLERGPSSAPSNDIEVARALLSFGERGVALWNGRRRRQPERFQLDRLDLSGLNISGADLSNCSLRNANLSKSVMYGCRFDESDLAGAKLTSARLEGSSFKHSRLLSATLTGASLRWCDFVIADLRNANLEDAALDPCNLGGADLTGAHFSSQRLDTIRELLQTLESAGEHPRHVFFALLGLCVFSVLISVGTPDLDLITSLGHIKIPVLDSDVSPRGFFFAAPIAFTVLSSYVAIHVKQLATAARELPARFPDGATLAEKLTPWMKNIAPPRVKVRPVLENGSDMSWSVPTVSERLLIACTYWVVPVCSAFMLAAYCRSRRPYDLGLVAVVVLGSWLLNHGAWRSVGRRAQEAPRDRRFLLALLVAAATIFAVGLVIGPLQAPNKSFDGQRLSHVRLRNAELRFADLSRVVFDHVDLSGALLLGATLKQSGGQQVTFYRARLDGTELTSSFFKLSDFSEAQFIGSKVTNSVFQATSFRDANVRNADFSGTSFDCIDLRGANLATAILTGAVARDLWCDSATKMLHDADGARFEAECDVSQARARDCRARLDAAGTSSWR